VSNRLLVIGLTIVGLLTVGARCIENTSVYVDESGVTHVVGEMYNDTGVSASNVVLRASLFHANGELIAEARGPLCPAGVQPHSSSAFDLRFSKTNLPAAARLDVRPISGTTIDAPLPPAGVFVWFEAKRFGVDCCSRYGEQRIERDLSVAFCVYRLL
jgi:hypothetical protein